MFDLREEEDDKENQERNGYNICGQCENHTSSLYCRRCPWSHGWSHQLLSGSLPNVRLSRVSRRLQARPRTFHLYHILPPMSMEPWAATKRALSYSYCGGDTSFCSSPTQRPLVLSFAQARPRTFHLALVRSSLRTSSSAQVQSKSLTTMELNKREREGQRGKRIYKLYSLKL